MSFMFFRKEVENGKLYYINDYDNFQLAGHGLIYQTWIKRGKPINKGWSVTANDLLQTYATENDDDSCNGDTYALLIDFHPTAQERIGIIEIERIHVYTYGADENAYWSPLLLELRQIYYDDDIDDFSVEYKTKVLEKIDVSSDGERIIEFLYLNGSDKSWNWGRNGMTNACFLHKEARDFFREYF